MKKSVFFPLVLGLACLSTWSMASSPLMPDPLPGHPRLLAQPDDWTRIKNQVQSDPVSARIFKSILQKGDQLLALPPVERKMEGRRLLDVSRTALERISDLALLARVTGEKRYARRAIDEMVAVARFTDWNPSHFLDTAEMSLAVAIGYDWLYDFLTPAEREEIASALFEKGLNPSLGTPDPDFVRGTNNWNQVCNAGMSAAAIALADRDPAVTHRVLKRSLEYLPRAAKSYAPDGAYEEGPMYWGYGTLFHVVLADSLQRFTGSTQGTDAYPGFAASADYIAQMTTPTGQFFDYSDAAPGRAMQLPLFWFARQFNRPDWIATESQNINRYLDVYDQQKGYSSNYRLLALVLLWHHPEAIKIPPNASPPPLHWYGKGAQPVVVYRSAFGDPRALYAAIKGGSPSLSHAHMDGGSFLIQSDGVVWADDLGMQAYYSLESLGIQIWNGKQGGERWTVFRLGPESHNILRFNGAPQLVNGSGTMTRVQLEGSRPFNVLDLSSLYEDQASQVRRGMMFLENKAVLIQDEWTAKDQPAEMTWQFLTSAEVTVEAEKIVLRKAGQSMILFLPDSPRASIKVEEAATLQKSFDVNNPGYRRITIREKTAAGTQGILRILAVPGSSGSVKAPDFQPLESWK